MTCDEDAGLSGDGLDGSRAYMMYLKNAEMSSMSQHDWFLSCANRWKSTDKNNLGMIGCALILPF